MENKEYRIGTQESNLVKIYLNDKNEYIVLNGGDSKVLDRFAVFMGWLDEVQAEIQSWKKGLRSPSGEALSRAEIMQAESVKSIGIYRECAARLDEIFGEGTIRKFFYAYYDRDEDFVPDGECFFDFINAVAPIVGDIYQKKHEKMKRRYNPERLGATGQAYEPGTENNEERREA